MDLITQGLLGATVGEVSSGKKLGNKAILWGAVAGLIPDMDTLFQRFLDVPSGLLFHRGITHSIFFSLLFTPLLAWILYRLYKRKFELKTWLILIFFSIFTHPLLDIMTVYGTGFFEPFSTMRIGFSTISVVDIFYTIPLLLSVIIVPFLKRQNKLRYNLNLILFLISHAYLVFTVGNKISVDMKMKAELKEQQINYTSYISSPYVLTNFLWTITAKVDSGYYTGTYNILNPSQVVEFEFIPQNNDLISDIIGTKQIKKLIFFSHDFYSLEVKDSTLFYYDLRYGKMQLPKNDRYVFTFTIQKEPLQIEQHYPEANFTSEDGDYMMDRILGKI